MAVKWGAPDAGAIWAPTAVIAASGFAGLGYEIVWIRELALALGSEMMATLGAVAGFFTGLSIGAFLLDSVIKRAKSPCLVYAGLETLIGVWGVVSVWLLPTVTHALPPLLGIEPAPALLWAASFALPVLVLLPATTAMGGTLAALERIASQTSGDARLSAGVYGANTAGAVAGTLASTFILLPAFGLSRTLLCLALVNALCGLGALYLRRFESLGNERMQRDSKSLTLTPRLILTLFATGLLGVAFEALVVRLAAQSMQDTVYTFAALLAAYLLGAAAGGLLWQRSGRASDEVSLSSLLVATALTCLATAALAPHISSISELVSDAGVVGELSTAMALFLLPATAMGALFGHLAQQVRDQRGALGFAVGVNSLGGAIAPLLASQILIPRVGAWTALLIVALGFLALLPLRRAGLAFAAIPLIAALIIFSRGAPSLIRAPAGGAIVAIREGPMATASVVDDAAGVRYLEINGHFRMGGTSSMRSDYRQAALPLLLHPGPRRALFLGVGTGATLMGGGKFPGVEALGVELSPEAVALLPWFANRGEAAPAPRVVVADARRFVVADKSHYDVIVADLFHPALDGSGALYTTEHFATVRERLGAGGLFCQWLPLYQLDQPSLQAIIRSFLAVYPDASAWLNHYSVRTPMLALIGHRAAASLNTDALAARLDDPAISAFARPLGFEAPLDLMGQFVAGANALASFAGEGPRNSDDFPFVTFDAQRNVRALTAPPWSLLIDMTRSLHADPLELLAPPARDALAGRLTAYWRARDRFLEAGAALQGDPRGRALMDAATPGLLDALRLSDDFDPAYAPLMSMARALIASDREAAQRLLSQIAEAAPTRREAQYLLAREFGR